MTAIFPLAFRWDGEVMRPTNARAADRLYVVGEVYRMEPVEDRSAASHRHYFAAINDAHDNLPHELAERFPTPDALRKYALIRTGFRDERSIIASSKAEARRLAAFIRPIDEFSVVSVHDAAVVVWTAKSQSMRAMGRKDFQASKDAVLGFVAELIGVAPGQLGRAA
jgi:hypothetical protein